MPSSDGEQRFGTIFMGPTPDRETTLDRLYDVTQRDIWNQRTEDEYMERIKARATERVRALLLHARKRGDEILTQAESRAGSMRAEAENVKEEAQAVREEAGRVLEDARAVREDAAAQRDSARQDGFEAGRAEALAVLDEERKALAETTAVVLLGIQEQCGHIFEAWREDLVNLTREAVEKGTGWVVDHERAAVLEALLDQSMRALLDRRHFTVRVHPADAALVTDMLADAHMANPRTADWELATDPKMEPGSLAVESDSALVDNSRKARRSVVDEVLEHLSLPQGAADQAAFDTVTATLVDRLRGHGVDLEDGGGAEGVPPVETPSPEEFINAAADPALQPDMSQPVIPPVDLSGESSAVAPDSFEPELPVPDPLPDPAMTDPVMPDPIMADQPDSSFPASSAFDPAQGEEFQPAPSLADPSLLDPSLSAPSMSESAAEPAPESFSPEQAWSGAEEGSAEPEFSPADGTPDPGGIAEEAQDLVHEFLDDAPPSSPVDDMAEGGLPPELADELLAEMGFGPDDKKA